MKFRWILLVTLAHFASTTCIIIYVLPGLLPTANTSDFDGQIRQYEFAFNAITFPVSLLQWKIPIIPLLINSLFWGWTTMALITLIRKRPSLPRIAFPAGGTHAQADHFLIVTLMLALFSFVITPVAAGSAIMVFLFLLLAQVVIHTIVQKLADKRSWTPRKTSTRFYACMVVLLTVFSLLTLAPWPSVSGRRVKSSEKRSFAETIMRLKRMQDRWIPFHLMMPGGIRCRTDFNVTQYFTILDRLTPETGWTLDYVYDCNELGGSPLLYAKRKWAVPFLTYSAYRNANPSISPEEEFHFLSHIKTDGTPEGFLQLTILRIMAAQFYLYWHAGYNDERIIHDRAELDTLLGKQGIFNKSTAEDRQKAASLDLQPVVTMTDKSVRVSLLTWTNWGGLYRKTFTISNAFPHRFEKEEKEQIVSYFCGIIY